MGGAHSFNFWRGRDERWGLWGREREWSFIVWDVADEEGWWEGLVASGVEERARERVS